MKRCYVEKIFSKDKLAIIEAANRFIAQYDAQGLELTLRQLYYRFVATGALPNKQQNYAMLGDVIADARLAGLIDWDAIVDRTRGLKAIHHSAHPRDVIKRGADSFHLWLWEDQPNYVEVWVEKDALVDIVGRACNAWDVPFFSCRGYTSLSELHAAARRCQLEVDHGKSVRIIHLGDHDPSGIDMTRNITERLKQTFDVPVSVYRVALNRNQIDEYQPPENPAKVTDSRYAAYAAEHGESSWELDALEPQVLKRIIQKNIEHWCDVDLLQARMAKQDRARATLQSIHDRWNEVTRMVKLPPLPQLQKPTNPNDYDAE